MGKESDYSSIYSYCAEFLDLSPEAMPFCPTLPSFFLGVGRTSGSCYVSQAGLQLKVLLPQFPGCCHCRLHHHTWLLHSASPLCFLKSFSHIT